MILLTPWMRRAMFATAGMNMVAAVGFLPGAQSLRALTGFPEPAHPFYALTVVLFVLLFGIGYLWSALVGQADRLFIAISAVGRLSFFALVVAFWSIGELPLRAPVLGSWDLIFGVLFVAWLLDTQTSPESRRLAAAPGARPS